MAGPDHGMTLAVVAVHKAIPMQTHTMHIMKEMRFLVMSSLIFIIYTLSPVLIIACLYLWVFIGRDIPLVIASCLASTILMPCSGPWNPFVDFMSRLYSDAVDYFQFRLIVEGELQPGRKYLFATFPHGLLSIGFVLHGRELRLRYPGVNARGLAASALFKVPILCHMLTWLGLVPASKSNMIQLLRNCFPQQVTLTMPGGIAEMWLSSGGEDKERIFMKHRKGFIAYALKAGCDIIPCYYLGNSQLFQRIPLGSVNEHDGFLSRLSRRFRISVIPFTGRFWIPLFPYKHPIVALQGKPIKVDKAIENPTQEQINELHHIFVKELTTLYERHRHELPGWENRDIEVL